MPSDKDRELFEAVDAGAAALVAMTRLGALPQWMIDACEEIASDPNCCDIQSSSADAMLAVLVKHAPALSQG